MNVQLKLNAINERNQLPGEQGKGGLLCLFTGRRVMYAILRFAIQGGQCYDDVEIDDQLESFANLFIRLGQLN